MHHKSADLRVHPAPEVSALPENTLLAARSEAEVEAAERLAAARTADAAWREQRKEFVAGRVHRLQVWGERLDRGVRAGAMALVAVIAVGTVVALMVAHFGPSGSTRGTVSRWSEWIGWLQALGVGVMLAGFALEALRKYWRRCGEREGMALDEPRE